MSLGNDITRICHELTQTNSKQAFTVTSNAYSCLKYKVQYVFLLDTLTPTIMDISCVSLLIENTADVNLHDECSDETKRMVMEIKRFPFKVLIAGLAVEC